VVIVSHPAVAGVQAECDRLTLSERAKAP
jgi:hypothetical protein